jgi:hypothetical protein
MRTFAILTGVFELTAGFIISVPAHAQSGSEGNQDVSNFAVPESPALAFLGAATSVVSRPLSARDLATQLANAIGPNGEVRQGISVDVTPYYLARHRISLDQYQQSVSAYGLANTVISFATVRSSGDSGSTDAGLGLRAVFFDGSDPMRSADFTKRVDSILEKCEPPDSQPPTQLGFAALCAEGRIDSARTSWLSEHWNASSFGIGMASGLRFEDSHLNRSHWIGISFWAAGSIRLGTFGSLIGQVAVDHRRGSLGQSSLTKVVPGGRLLVGSPSFTLYAEIAPTNYPGAPNTESRPQWTGGVEFKASADLWIATGFGTRFSTAAQDRVVVVANVRWILSQQSKLKKR